MAMPFSMRLNIGLDKPAPELRSAIVRLASKRRCLMTSPMRRSSGTWALSAGAPAFEACWLVRCAGRRCGVLVSFKFEILIDLYGGVHAMLWRIKRQSA